jgi:two-component system cell cycle sensor histidine kinase/response regulator CckA
VGRDAPDAKYSFAAIEHPERYAHVTLEDSGSGMSAETLSHIFEPLFTTKKTGTGLGLSVARHVMTRHGGEIFAESTPGVGTKFHLFLPLSKEALGAGAIAGAASPGARRSYQRILIVEDERAVAAGLSALFEMEGIQSDVIENGRDVLPAIERFRPDAVILDIGLPDMDGTAVFAQLSELHPRMPVVFSTGHGDASKLEPYLARPHVAFLLKPYEIDTLLDTLDRVVG